MIIGILSDSHGDCERTLRAAQELCRKGAKALIHCGDIGSEGVLQELAGIDIPVHAVLGNVDLYDPFLKSFPTDIGIQIHGRFADLHLGQKRIAVMHGDDEKKLFETIKSDAYDYVFRGHTHIRSDEHIGKTRVINPGALYRTHTHSVALLDVIKDDLEFILVQ